MRIEKLVADTINNNPIKIELRGRVFNVPRPTLGTLIEVSKLISEIPEIKADGQKAVYQTLFYARDCDKIPEIIAMLILGKKNFEQCISVFGYKIRLRNRLALLTEQLQHFTCEELSGVFVEILKSLDCAFFLGLTTSLNAVNQLRPTKTEATASGQQ